MIKRKEDLIVEKKQNLRNGKGHVVFQHIIKDDELKNRAKLFTKITIPVGNSIGMHEHLEDFEVYYILKGRGKVLDGEKIVDVFEGDVVYTANGEKHYIENIGNEELEMLAVVINV